MSDLNQGERTRHQVVGLFLGPLLATAMLLSGTLEGLSHEGWMTASVGVLMAVAWVSRPMLVTIPKMAKAGIMLNFVSIVVVSLIALYLGPRFL